MEVQTLENQQSKSDWHDTNARYCMTASETYKHKQHAHTKVRPQTSAIYETGRCKFPM